MAEAPPFGESYAEGIAERKTGEPLLRVLTENLAKTIGARYAFLSEVVDQTAGKVRVIASVHSLDTGVCSDETKRLSEMAKELPNVEFLTISMDLPFAQARWCGANDVENVVTASDFRDRRFGEAYGVLMKEVGLLSRATFVVGRDGNVQYAEYCPENSIQPNYDAITEVVKRIL